MAKMNLASLKEKLFTTKVIIWGVVGFAVFSIILLTVQSMMPRQGNIVYGMCARFLELQVPFPETIEQKDIELYRKGVRINYTHYDGFGEYRLEMIECSFLQDPERGVQLESVLFNYVKPSTYNERIVGKGRLYSVRKEVIDLFNDSKSPAAMLQDIDLSIPDSANVRSF